MPASHSWKLASDGAQRPVPPARSASSRSRAVKLAGSAPDNPAFLAKPRALRLERLPSSGGIGPVSALPKSHSVASLNREIYVMNADGSGVTRLTNASGWDLSGRWSPDGTRILFLSDRVGNDEIYVIRLH